MASVVFTPTAEAPFQFGLTLDGADYVATVTWNLYAQRWYLSINQIDGTLVMCRALIACTPAWPINLVFGYFVVSSLMFDDVTQTFTVTP